jgi:hypothetical protein
MMHMIRKEQIRGVEKGNIQAQNQFIAGLFGLAMQARSCQFVFLCLQAGQYNYLQRSHGDQNNMF